MSPSDAELIEAASRCDEEAWEQIIGRYQPLINAISRRHRLAPYDVRDVSQYVWMQLLGHIRRLREPRALPGWISATTTHRCYEILRKYRRFVSIDPLVTGHFDLVDTADPPIPYAEISRRMDVPIGSIGPTRARLLKKLQRSIPVRQLTEEVPSLVSAAA